MIGLILLILAPIYVYRNAKQNGHNAGFWTVITIAIGLFGQIFLPIAIGITIGVVMAVNGSSETEIEKTVSSYSFILTIASIVVTAFGYYLIANKINQVKDDEIYQNPPAPNEYFNNENQN